MWPFTASPSSSSSSSSSSASSTTREGLPNALAEKQRSPSSATTPNADKCPVDHSTRSTWLSTATGSVASSSTPNTVTSPEACPVDHETRSIWLANATASSSSTTATPTPSHPLHHPSLGSGSMGSSRTNSTRDIDPTKLPTDRITSSIPRGSPSFSSTPRDSTPTSVESPVPKPESDPKYVPIPPATPDEKWVYPSELQFFNAMLRKNHNPKPEDMATIVPIHNAVNEKAWQEVLKWENGMGGESCGGVKLVSFVGRPRDRSPKAILKMALGYNAPFDRHDWVVTRCGKQIRYVIDFYTGRTDMQNRTSLAFHLDVRPALDDWEGVRTRLMGLFGQ